MSPLRGVQLPLLNSIEPQTVENAPLRRCNHRRAIPGLDAHYCPDCKKSIVAGTADYQRILNMTKPKSRSNGGGSIAD